MLPLVEDPVLQAVEETHLEEFDLERLARISEAQPIEPPRFTLLEPAPRFRLRRTLAVAFLAAIVVSGLATLRPDANSSYTPVLGPQGVTTTANACPVGD